MPSCKDFLVSEAGAEGKRFWEFSITKKEQGTQGPCEKKGGASCSGKTKKQKGNPGSSCFQRWLHPTPYHRCTAVSQRLTQLIISYLDETFLESRMIQNIQVLIHKMLIVPLWGGTVTIPFHRRKGGSQGYHQGIEKLLSSQAWSGAVDMA